MKNALTKCNYRYTPFIHTARNYSGSLMQNQKRKRSRKQLMQGIYTINNDICPLH